MDKRQESSNRDPLLGVVFYKARMRKKEMSQQIPVHTRNENEH